MQIERAANRHQAGATAIEFAFVFPLLFAIIYGTIAYGYVYFLQQRINFAAQEAVRAAIAVDPAADGYMAAVQAAAVAAVTRNFTSIVGPSTLPTVTFPSSTPPDPNALKVTLTYSLTTPLLFPTVTLPLVGAIPPLPANLIASAVGKLS